MHIRTTSTGPRPELRPFNLARRIATASWSPRWMLFSRLALRLVTIRPSPPHLQRSALASFRLPHGTRQPLLQRAMSTPDSPSPAFASRPTLPFDLGSLGKGWGTRTAADGSHFAVFERHIERSANDKRDYRQAPNFREDSRHVRANTLVIGS